MARRGPYEKGQAKRKEILLAALEVFAAEGYRGTSLRKVADRCGLSLPGLMHYFESKEDLLTQVVRMRDETARLRHPDHTPETYRRIVREGTSTPGLVELFVSMAAAAGDPRHPAHGHFAERYPQIRGQVAAFLRGCMDEGWMRADVPADRLAALFVAVADGIQMQWLVDRSMDMEQPIADVMRLLTSPDARAATDARAAGTRGTGEEGGGRC
ncbi:TetR/AcrR family transcriptional regulator [Actinomadura montaniterrae]|uniref:TetR/AcrR family transcriptional regulator n=1 Tax=Actinomadura montaniterrae TaxID=1803903 RepID=A0A6L3VVD9_9ACTN|nr:TetR/AcrR family transcriptional regulator [Actinomadura montaniterrae]KAB2374167.1 TetR/AcrR family transcriptional regulator [Actinomadura montaniterrae]